MKLICNGSYVDKILEEKKKKKAVNLLLKKNNPTQLCIDFTVNGSQ